MTTKGSRRDGAGRSDDGRRQIGAGTGIGLRDWFAGSENRRGLPCRGIARVLATARSKARHNDPAREFFQHVKLGR